MFHWVYGHFTALTQHRRARLRQRVSEESLRRPVVVGNRTVIPAAQVRYAFGGGGGAKAEAAEHNGGGGRGHLSARPRGGFEVRAEGTPFLPFNNRRNTGAAVAPGFISG